MGISHDSSFILFDMSPQSAICPPKSCGEALDISPMSFDRVYHGHIINSSMPWFQLPIELLPQITRYLSKKDLSSLSLVDRDCWKLASVGQFKRLQMIFNDQSCDFIRSFQSNQTRSNHQLIHSCVRRLDVSLNSEIAVPLDAALPGRASDPSSRELEFVKKSGFSVNEYITAVGQVIEQSLPNLHILDWDLPLAISQSQLSLIYASSAKHLRLSGVILVDDVHMPPKVNSLPLETLSLLVSWPIVENRVQSYHLFHHILRHAAPTLHQLEWIGQALSIDIYMPKDMPFFPHLRSIIIDRIASHCDQVLDVFLGPSTRVSSLSMDSATTSTCNFYRNRGYISTLRHLCWVNKFDATLSYDDVIAFLGENSQLEAVHVSDGLPHAFLDSILLPLLHNNFTFLTSLKLVWSAPDIHESSLRTISSISTLRHLWLSAGNQDSFRNTWEVNVELVIECLAPLHQLKTLAFSRDTYKVKSHPLAPRFCDYYATKAVPVDIDISKYLSITEYEIYCGSTAAFEQAVTQQIVMRRLAWERWHAERMLESASRVAQVFPELTWCFLGQLAIGAESEYGRRSVSLEAPHRHPCLSALHKKMSINVWRPA